VKNLTVRRLTKRGQYMIGAWDYATPNRTKMRRNDDPGMPRCRQIRPDKDEVDGLSPSWPTPIKKQARGRMRLPAPDIADTLQRSADSEHAALRC
jgi:hypothetical protein